MKKQYMRLDFDLKFQDIESLNPSFSLAKVAIAYAGKNRNNSIISKEVFEEAVPSLFYCPLVGRYDPDKDDFGGHDIRVVTDDTGNISIENATVPFGVVYGGTKPYWETVTEEDGTEREYLFCDVILWKRQYGYNRLIQQNSWHQSMEIQVDSFIVDDKGCFIIEKMTFQALCILGNDVTPCFEGASVQMFSNNLADSYSQQFSLMLEDLKKLKEYQHLRFELDSLKIRRDGEMHLTDEKITEILSKYGYTREQLQFEITEDMTEESLVAALDAMKLEHSATFAATYLQRRNALLDALKPVIERDSNGNVISETYYWFYDFDDEYVYVERSVFTQSGSTDTFGRLKYAISDGEKPVVSIEGEFEEMVLQWLTLEENEKLQKSRNAFELLSQEFEEYKKEHVTKESEVEELRKFKNERLEADHKDAINEVLQEFSDLADNPEFVSLIEDGKAYEYKDPTELQKECYAIRGKAITPSKFSKQEKSNSVKVFIKDKKDSKSRYGDLFEIYGN